MRGGAAARLAAVALIFVACRSSTLAEPAPEGGVLIPRDPAGGTGGVAADDARAAPGGAGAAMAVDASSTGGAGGREAGNGDAGSPVTHIARTHVVYGGPIGAQTIAADGSGVFGLTEGNGVWALPVGATVPRVLAQDPGTPDLACHEGGRMITAGDDLFWVARRASPGQGATTALHRTSKDGARDVVLVDHLAGAAGPFALAADDASIYWREMGSPTMGEGTVRALPRDASPGTPPAVLVTAAFAQEIRSLAVNDRSLYWTPFDAIGSTIFTSELWTGDKFLLAAGDVGTAHHVSSIAANFVATSGDDVYVVFWAEQAMRLARLSGDSPLIVLGETRENIVPDAMVFVDGWVVISVSSSPCDTAHRLFAAPASGGGGLTLIADHLITSVALGADGLTFLNADSQLVAISPADLGLALSAGP